jgi:hypothetical protein
VIIDKKDTSKEEEKVSLTDVIVEEPVKKQNSTNE